MPDLIGQHIGQYEIIALLGKGGMAEVYRARQTLAGGVARDVALKLIDPRLAATPEFIARFKREAQTLVSLSHPHILKAFDFGQYQDTVYLVMELLTGGSLAESIRQGPLPLPTILRVLEQTAQALDYAHSKGLVHRDLKPQNVLLDESGNAFLTDFGIVKLLNHGTALTQSQAAIGTPAYMAPEQWTGDAIDARADLYSLGIMLFEMLTGHVPFRGETPHRIMFQHISEAPPPVHTLRSAIPPGVDQVIAAALAKDPTQRYPTAVALLDAFKSALGGQAPSVAAQPTTVSLPPPGSPTAISAPGTKPGAPTTRNRSLVIGVAAIVLLAVVGLGGGIVINQFGKSTPTSIPPVSRTAPEIAIVTTGAPVIALIITAPPSTATVTVAPPSNTATAIPSSTPLPPTASFTNTPLPTLPPPTSTPTPSPSPTNTPIPPTLTPTATLRPTASPTNTARAVTATSPAPASSTCQAKLKSTYGATIKLEVFAGPSTASGVLTLLTASQTVPVIGKTADQAWWEVNIGQIGWVSSDDTDRLGNCDSVPVVTVTPAPTTVGIMPTLAACQAKLKSIYGASIKLEVFAGPSTASGVLTLLTASQTVPVIGKTADQAWWEVNVGQTGWVSSDDTDRLGNCGSVPVVTVTPMPTATSIVSASAACQVKLKSIYGAITLPIYSGPDVTFNIVTFIPSSQTMPVIGKTADQAWWEVNFGQTGWVRSFDTDTIGNCDSVPTVTVALAPKATGITLTPTSCQARLKSIYGTATLPIYSGPSIDSNIVSFIPSSQTVPVIGKTADQAWWEVNVGQTGWVRTFDTDTVGDCSKIPSLHPTPTPTIVSIVATRTPLPISTVKTNKQWKTVVQFFNGQAMMLVPPGCFNLGSTTGDTDEKPVNKQCITQPFWIDRYEVSQAQFKALGGKAATPPGFPGDQNPIEDLTWDEARTYCLMRGGRLPTEVEWEYAARGPDDLIYPWGNTFIAANVIYIGNSKGQTANVSSDPGGASWVGALNMAGNVWEWTSSLYRPYPYNAADGRESNTNAPLGDLRVVRGGSWGYDAAAQRGSTRNGLDPTSANGDVGVRCVRDY